MKKRNFWKGTSFFAVVFALFVGISVSLTACGKKETKQEALKQEDEKKETKKETKQESTGDDYTYQTSFQELGSVKSTSFNDMCRYDDKIYTIGSYSEENKETGNYSTQYCLLECTIDGSDWKETELSLEKDEYIQAMTVNDKDSFYILTMVSSYDEKTQNQKEQYYIKQLKPDGSIEEDHKLKKEKDTENFYLGGRGTMLARDGSVYAADYENSIFYFDQTGKQGKTFDMRASVENIVQTEDGSIYAYGDLGEDRKSALRKLNLEQQKFEKPVLMGEASILNTESYSAGPDSIYLQNDNGIYHIATENGTIETLFDWINQDIDGQEITSYVPLEDGGIFAIISPFNRNKKIEIAIIKKVKSSEVKEKTKLTLACTYLTTSLKESVLNFNKTNENYRIEIKDYSSYEDRNERLNLDIISGQVPDIISLDELPINTYVKKGLLTDLYPFMEKDAEIKKEDFIDSVITTLEQDGKLYYLNSTFRIDAWFVGEKYLKEAEGWNFEEMQELYESKSKENMFFYYTSREIILQDLMLGQMDQLIDWNTGEVHMDTEELIHMLEFSKNFPSGAEADISDIDIEKAVKKGDIMLMDGHIYNISDIELQTSFFKKAGGFHIVSYPSEDKNNRICMNYANPPLAITEQCKDKEGAWEFIRQDLTYYGQLSLTYDSEGFGNGIPIRKDVFEKVLEYAMATEEYEDNGMTIKPKESNYSYNSYGIPIGPISQEEADTIRNVVDRIGILNLDGDIITTSIIGIVKEETEAMYAGDKTAEQVAEIIQNRVKILVSENS